MKSGPGPRGWCAALVAAIALAACSSGSSSSSDSSSGADTGGFVAYASNFDQFHNWSSAPATSTGDDAGDGLHGVGPLRVYWSAPPPHGSTSFPVGTIIVKETEDTDVTRRVVFAMVKRGDGYNSGGANGWMWYSLADNADGSVSILWSGVAAPAGQTYANQAIGDCNGCHELAASNDAVWDDALQLSKF